VGMPAKLVCSADAFLTRPPYVGAATG
jgi:hypothetical protein